MDRLARKYLRLRKIPSTACSGCGLGQAHKKILLAIEELGLGIDDIVWGTGIGCSGRQLFNTWKGDNFAGTHGRVYAIATGLRVALPPEKKIILTAGDSDAFGIGLSHLLHCARRNLGVAVVVLDNFGCQSTGGQYAQTTPLGSRTDSSPYGMQEPNWLQNGIDILAVLREAGATFLARHSSLEAKGAIASLKKAIANPGFSLVHIVCPCITHYGAAALKTREREEIFRWFCNLFKASTREGAGFHLKSGVYHDAAGSRPEFSAHLRDWTRAVRARAEAGKGGA
ncbi:MAG: 2-oxoglutarate ferredoxin oxidoreductase subunit beta [Candidatus Accumulibacter sp.]|jgi:2-oxoglutarate ferredoxin oxidoreductase subunit beta|nr:2-oxoglutarate ferredoxin oxidoreductase subunit beta [Accumulibacter sp.]